MSLSERAFCDECQAWHAEPVSQKGVDGPGCQRWDVDDGWIARRAELRGAVEALQQIAAVVAGDDSGTAKVRAVRGLTDRALRGIDGGAAESGA